MGGVYFQFSGGLLVWLLKKAITAFKLTARKKTTNNRATNSGLSLVGTLALKGE